MWDTLYFRLLEFVRFEYLSSDRICKFVNRMAQLDVGLNSRLLVNVLNRLVCHVDILHFACDISHYSVGHSDLQFVPDSDPLDGIIGCLTGRFGTIAPLSCPTTRQQSLSLGSKTSVTARIGAQPATSARRKGSERGGHGRSDDRSNKSLCESCDSCNGAILLTTTAKCWNLNQYQSNAKDILCKCALLCRRRGSWRRTDQSDGG
jgi:hypothetical protein